MSFFNILILHTCHFVENTQYQYSISDDEDFLQSGGNKYQHIINQREL